MMTTESMNRQRGGIVRKAFNRILPTDTDHAVAETPAKSIHGSGELFLPELPLFRIGKKRQLGRLALQPVTDQAAAANSRPSDPGALQRSQCQFMQKKITGSPDPAGGLAHHMPAVRISQPDPHPSGNLLLSTQLKPRPADKRGNHPFKLPLIVGIVCKRVFIVNTLRLSGRPADPAVIDAAAGSMEIIAAAAKRYHKLLAIELCQRANGGQSELLQFLQFFFRKVREGGE